ncbi:MAG: hypothetical protein ACNA7X_04330 [Dehalococcoidia bacterium]
MDTDPAMQLWDDTEIENMIQRVVGEYSLRAPIEHLTETATAAGDTEVDISALTELLRVVSVEFPIDLAPPFHQRFRFWAGRLFMPVQGDATDCRIQWLGRHEITAVSTTVPEEHQELLIMGATGYLAMSVSAHTVDRATISGEKATVNYRDWGKDRLARYDGLLKAVAWSRRLQVRQLYVEE